MHGQIAGPGADDLPHRPGEEGGHGGAQCHRLHRGQAERLGPEGGGEVDLPGGQQVRQLVMAEVAAVEGIRSQQRLDLLAEVVGVGDRSGEMQVHPGRPGGRDRQVQALLRGDPSGPDGTAWHRRDRAAPNGRVDPVGDHRDVGQPVVPRQGVGGGDGEPPVVLRRFPGGVIEHGEDLRERGRGVQDGHHRQAPQIRQRNRGQGVVEDHVEAARAHLAAGLRHRVRQRGPDPVDVPGYPDRGVEPLVQEGDQGAGGEATGLGEDRDVVADPDHATGRQVRVHLQAARVGRTDRVVQVGQDRDPHGLALRPPAPGAVRPHPGREPPETHLRLVTPEGAVDSGRETELRPARRAARNRNSSRSMTHISAASTKKNARIAPRYTATPP